MGSLSFANTNFSHGDFKKHFHEDYSIALIYKGVHKFSTEKERYAIDSVALRVIHPFEFHATYDSSWSHISFLISPEYLNHILEEKQLYFKFDSIIDSKESIHLGFELFNALKNKDTFLKEEKQIEFFSYLANYHSQISNQTINQVTKKEFSRAYDFINDNFTEDLSLEKISKEVGVSKYHFLREFKKIFGVTPHKYIQFKRANKAKELLEKKTPLEEIAYLCGFSDQPHLINSFKKYFGYSPSNLKFFH